MTNVYDIISKTKSFLRENPSVNTVTFGDITQVNLNKTTIFPLAHFLLNNVQITERSVRVTLSMLFIDIVDYTKEFNPDDEGDREDASNLLDVYNTQLYVANSFITDLRRGNLFVNGFRVVGDPILTPFKDRFENELAGWSVDVTLDTANDVSLPNEPTC